MLKMMEVVVLGVGLVGRAAWFDRLIKCYILASACA